MDNKKNLLIKLKYYILEILNNGQELSDKIANNEEIKITKLEKFNKDLKDFSICYKVINSFKLEKENSEVIDTIINNVDIIINENAFYDFPILFENTIKVLLLNTLKSIKIKK